MPALPIASGILEGIRHRIPDGAGAVAWAGVVWGTAPGDWRGRRGEVKIVAVKS
jgi:hypothetical protein